jgi:hypothetical protein
MKITKRIAEEAYCYTELEFSSLEEYESQYPIFAEAMRRMKKKLAMTPEEQFKANLPGYDEQPFVKTKKK